MEAKESFRQIFGTETEWPVSVRLEGRADFIQLDIKDTYRKFLVSYLPEELISTAGLYSSATNSNFLSNGARYYHDIGSRLEYATPEDVSVESTVLSEDAGEWIVAEGLRRLVASDNRFVEGFLSRRVDGIDRKTWGYHINIGEDREWLGATADVAYRTRPMLTHLATSMPMLGGGSVYRNKEGEYKYSYGQKVLTPIVLDYGSSTTLDEQKPIVSVRDEPLSDKEKYNRLHIVGLDPHISPWAKRMTIGTMSLVLLACKEGRMRGMIPLSTREHPAARIMRQTSSDMSMTDRYYLEKDKKSRTIFDVQEEIIEAVEKTKSRTAEQDTMLDEWKKSFAEFRSNPHGFLKSDAILKRTLVERDMDRRGKKEPDAKSRYIDMLYTSPIWVTKESAQQKTTDELLAESFSGRVVQRYFDVDADYNDRKKDRVLNPPKTTRAYRRGNEIKRDSARWTNWNGYFSKDEHGIVSNRSSVADDPLEGAIEQEYNPRDY